MGKFITKSPWVYHMGMGGCNACDIEIVAALTPRYDVERFGIKLVGSPKHADILLVTGTMTSQIKKRILNVYEQIPSPKAVVVVGVCASSRGAYHGEDNYAIAGPIDRFVPVDEYVFGCPPRPEAIALAVLKAAAKLGEKK